MRTLVKSFFNRAFGSSSGVGWFLIANTTLPLLAIILGPLILRKVGLEDYALMALAAYFFNLITSYSDFSSTTHLVATASRNEPDFKEAFAGAVTLRTIIWLCFGMIIFLWGWKHPHDRPLCILIAISYPSVMLPSAILEWKFIAARRYFDFFVVRMIMAGVQFILIVAWYNSRSIDSRFVILISLISAIAGSAVTLVVLRRQISSLLQMPIHFFSIRQAANLAKKLAPMSAVLVLAPYFSAYALPWYSMVQTDRVAVGEVSIAYRIAMGLNTLAVPMIFHFMSASGALQNRWTNQMAALKVAALSVCGWCSGLAVIWVYVLIGKVDPEGLIRIWQAFSIIMLAVLCVSIRTPYVAACLREGRYREYFAIHLIACLPAVLYSLMTRNSLRPELVLWLACIPDAVATLVFWARSRTDWSRTTA